MKKPCIGLGRCPLKLSSFPTEQCPEATKELDGLKDGIEGKGCPWAISDPESKGCFWAFMSLNAGTAHTEAQIAQKLLIDDSTVKKIIGNFKRRSKNSRADFE
jgi:hypothetical protein